MSLVTRLIRFIFFPYFACLHFSPDDGACSGISWIREYDKFLLDQLLFFSILSISSFHYYEHCGVGMCGRFEKAVCNKQKPVEVIKRDAMHPWFQTFLAAIHLAKHVSWLKINENDTGYISTNFFIKITTFRGTQSASLGEKMWFELHVGGYGDNDHRPHFFT